MHPNGVASAGSPLDRQERRGGRQSRAVENPRSRSVAQTPRIQTEDSWVEISSLPSSSSLSSAGENDVITTGLRVRRPHYNRRTRSLHLQTSPRADSTGQAGPPSAAGSSQDEYDESESESDRVLNSSTEDMMGLVGDDDDSSTAPGAQTAEQHVFTPQPNAFSHPPTSRNSSQSAPEPSPGSYFPLLPAETTNAAAADRTITQRNFNQQRHSLPRSFPNDRRTNVENTPARSIGQQDHDAALRASLTTLLSCAAAVRGSPKSAEIPQTSGGHRRHQVEPSMLRLVPESELLGQEPPSSPPRHSSKRQSPGRPTISSRDPAAAKRKARESSKERQTKKMKNVVGKTSALDGDMVLPSTLMSWMISAGIVLVFSAVSFSAGYAWGKEVGRFEGEMGISGGTCGREVLRSGNSLRRLKWSTAASSIRA